MTNVVVFGATGNIGKRLAPSFRLNGWNVAGTSTHAHESLVPFRMESDDFSRTALAENDWDYGVICSAITSIDECKRNYVLSQSVNVDGTIRLAEQLVQRGIRPVFLSSDYVFSGKKGGYIEIDQADPVTVYGRQKAEVEAWLQRHASDAVVVRLGKVLSSDPLDASLFSEWYSAIAKDEAIKCASDQWFCPVCICDVVAALKLTIELRLAGLYHICQPERFDRTRLLKLFCSTLGMREPRIKELPSREFGFLDSRSRDTSMLPVKFQAVTGFEFTPMDVCCRRFGERLNIAC